MSDFFYNLKAMLAAEDGSLSLQLVVWSVILGFIIAMVIIFYNKRLIGSFVRALLAAKAYDEYTAKTAAELDQSDNVFALSAYRRRGALSRVVSSLTDERGATKYDISEANRQRAEKQYDDRGTEPLYLFLAIAALIIIGFLIVLLLPLILA